ncbi:MAG: nicotinamide-nucleotide amidase, partial [Bacteroidia bacterium]
MKAEIITIGDEILIGQVVDTNSAWIGQQLNPLGWDVARITTISDDANDITNALSNGIEKSDLVIITGGLGPTKDDITKTTLCTFFDAELVFDETAFKNVERIFNYLKRDVTQVNRDQALIPSNAMALPNNFGTAPGLWIESQNTIIVCLPGVPYEMKDIMTNEVFPRIKDLSTDVVQHRTLVISGIPESIISEQIEHIETKLPKAIKIAYLPNYNIVRLRISGRGSSEIEVGDLLNEVVSKIKEVLGAHVVSETDRRIEEIVGELLKKSGKTASFAESCTGGYVAHLITTVPGSSGFFPGSVVTYSYENKTEVLGVDADLLWTKGAVSQEVVEKMCRSVRVKNGTDYGLAISGIAGPSGGTIDKPVGTVWMAVCDAKSV